MGMRVGIKLWLAAILFCSAALLLCAQSDNPPKPKTNKQTDTPTKNAEDQPKWDPVRAEKDLEVGKYYMKTGNVDAAIDRFQDAIEAKPGYAIPFLYLGEAQEKKGMKRDAIKSYTRYLELYPKAEDRAKVEKKIEKLRAEVDEKKKKESLAKGPSN
jgi:tetratricopeptide (TPR) repeat protein